MALKSILNNKIRSLLTMLGIIIGVASVIAIVASIQGTTKLQKLQYTHYPESIIVFLPRFLHF